jgi:hypothetical protein
MQTVKILDATIPVEFLVGEAATIVMDEPSLLKELGEMAACINKGIWPPEYKAAFEVMRKIVFFEGKIEVNGYLIDRPCCDEDDAVFYWESSEFVANTEVGARANTYFHDCWHVMQFRAAGNRFAADERDRVDREVDAINHQIKVAELLECSKNDMAFLARFRDDQGAIKLRLAEGVDRMRHARPGESGGTAQV